MRGDMTFRASWAVSVLVLVLMVAPYGHCQTRSTSGGAAYPTKPIRLIVPQAAGGNNDLVGRLVAEHLNQALNVPIVIDNRPGAGGNVGNELAAKATGDGYTLLHASPALVTSPALYSTLSYDATRDLAAIGITALIPQVLVVSVSVPAKSVKELIDLARKRPGQLNYGSAGVGSGPHVSAALFVKMANVDITHVPYKGTSLAVIDLLAGNVQVQFGGLPALIPHIRSGKIRALGISTARRSQALPDLPAIAEAGVPGYDTAGWLGLAAPAGTPAAIVSALSAQVEAFKRKPDTAKRFLDLGAEAVDSSPASFAKFIRYEIDQWKKVLK